MTIRKPIALVSDVRFWDLGVGMYLRSLEMIRYLSQYYEVHILFTGLTSPSTKVKTGRYRRLCQIHWVNDSQEQTDDDKRDNISSLVTELDISLCIFFRMHSAKFRQAIPVHIPVILDVDDIYSEAVSAKESVLKQESPEKRSWEEDLEVLKYFDALIAIQTEHLNKIRQYCPDKAVVLAGHSLEITPQLIRQSATNISFVGSGWESNVDGMHWFLNEVWPALSDQHMTLNLFGRICSTFHTSSVPNIVIHNYVSDLSEIYEMSDVIINPVRFGSGLKIKSLEAIANGLPLVTTSEGARGLKHLDRQALLIADDPKDFASALSRLANDRTERSNLAKGALQYAKENFSPEVCYGDLRQLMEEL